MNCLIIDNPNNFGKEGAKKLQNSIKRISGVKDIEEKEKIDQKFNRECTAAVETRLQLISSVSIKFW